MEFFNQQKIKVRWSKKFVGMVELENDAGRRLVMHIAPPDHTDARLLQEIVFMAFVSPDMNSIWSDHGWPGRTLDHECGVILKPSLALTTAQLAARVRRFILDCGITVDAFVRAAGEALDTPPLAPRSYGSFHASSSAALVRT
jgi:hypothetical protein